MTRTPSTLLADLYRQGVTLRVSGDRLGVKAPEGVLTREVQSALKAHKLQLLELVALATEYRKLLRDGFALVLRPGGPSGDEREVFLDEQARITDDLGPTLARTIYRLAAREWRDETGVCPWCDDGGACHEPTDDAI